MANKIFTNKRIGILGKGGSGKSTVTVLLAQAFIKSGYQVCVLDADSTNTGVHQALGFKKPPASLMEYFGGAVFAGGKVTCPVDDPTPLSEADVSLNRIPAKYYVFDKKGLFLCQLGKIGDKGPGAGCDGPISKIARDFKVYGIGDEPVTLIDVKAGLEDSARGVITSMDWVISVVDPNTAAIQIAEDIRDLIVKIRAGVLPATKHLDRVDLVEEMKRIYRESKIRDSFVIVNKTKNRQMADYVTRKLQAKRLKVIGVVHDDPVISMSWLKGNALKGTKAGREIIAAIRKLEQYVKE